MIEKVTSVNRVVQVFPLVIAELPRLIVATVDPALSTNTVRAFDGRQADQIDGNSQLA